MLLNYAMIIDYLVNQNIQGQELADLLNTDATLISKIKNNRKPMIKGCSPTEFYENIFLPKPYLTNNVGINKLYEYLCERNCSNELIDNAYKNYSSTSDAKAFIICVLECCSYDEDKSSTSNKKAAQKQVYVEFKEYKNPLDSDTSRFFGRRDTLLSIASILKKEGTCILYGIGGMGKSYCSLKYALEYKSNYKNIQQVIFENDLRSTLLKVEFVNLDENNLSEEEKIENRLSILSSFDEQSLLIIDNMDNEMSEADRRYYNRLKQFPMHILITSRETKVDSDKYLLPMQPLTRDEQLQLFQYYGEFTISEQEISSYYDIFDLVEGHTLLLELIAKTMAVETLTPDEMIEILNSSEDVDISKVSIEKDNTYQQEKMDKYVSTLFDTSKLSASKKEILMFLSLTSIEGIRQRVFKRLINCDNSDINELVHQSWIITTVPSGPDSARVHLHPVIKTATIRNTEPTIEKTLSFIKCILSAIASKDTLLAMHSDYVDLCNILANACELFKFGIEDIDLLGTIAEQLWDNLFFSRAHYIYRDILDMITKASYDNPQIEIDICEKAGNSAVRLALYDDAISYYLKAVSIIENHKEIAYYKKLATIYDNLGSVMRKASRYKESLDYYKNAESILDIYEINDDTLRADLLNNIGVTYINLGILDKALENYQKALEIRKTIPDIDKAQLAYSYHNIGTVFQRQKKYKEAIKWHTMALDIRREICMENDPIIAASLTMIGNDYTQAANSDPSFSYDDAKSYFIEGLEIREATLGKMHPDTAWSHQSIGDWHFYQGNYNDALSHYNECLKIRETFLRPGHAYIGEVMKKIGEVYCKIHNYTNAIDYLTKALEINKALDKVRAQDEIRALITTCKQSSNE